MIELSEDERRWVASFTDQIYKLPKALSLYIDNQRDSGNVEVFSAPDKDFTKAQKRWINELEQLIENFPDSQDFWLLSNMGSHDDSENIVR